MSMLASTELRAQTLAPLDLKLGALDSQALRLLGTIGPVTDLADAIFATFPELERARLPEARATRALYVPAFTEAPRPRLELRRTYQRLDLFRELTRLFIDRARLRRHARQTLQRRRGYQAWKAHEARDLEREFATNPGRSVTRARLAYAQLEHQLGPEFEEVAIVFFLQRESRALGLDPRDLRDYAVKVRAGELRRLDARVRQVLEFVEGLDLLARDPALVELKFRLLTQKIEIRRADDALASCGETL